jgi:[ribosomal protein S5]-alanine N-acetyltransferase
MEIVTERLLIRDFVAEDWLAAHAYRADPEVTRYMLIRPSEGPEQTRAAIEQRIREAQQSPRERYTLALTLRSDGRLIGQIWIGPSADDFPAEDEIGFGYMLHRDHWGQGYGTEAARAIVRFGFDEMGARQVSAWCFEANRASARVLEKAGLCLALREEDVDPRSALPRISLKYTVGREAWR